jgi:hypothetical protein
MSDYVIVLGAGFSYDAGIPLMNGFVDAMWELAVRKRINDKPLSEVDIKIFDDAEKVRLELDNYHGRANFNDRNIEDILSILSFGSLRNKEVRTTDLSVINKAIARTIELKCNVESVLITENGLVHPNNSGHEQYRKFWHLLFHWSKTSRTFPAIITFNYDLVLERSFFQQLSGAYCRAQSPLMTLPDLRIKYYGSGLKEDIYRLERCQARIGNETMEQRLMRLDADGSDRLREIEILKLHGSLNFPTGANGTGASKRNITLPVENPCILPPIFNKTYTEPITEIWRVALERLGQAKNIIFVGYSLPATDIYMQYFLKAAFGPNKNLNKIFVFDPLTVEDRPASEDIKTRYRQCLAEPLRNRLSFSPPDPGAAIAQRADYGKTSHFLRVLGENPAAILF